MQASRQLTPTQEDKRTPTVILRVSSKAAAIQKRGRATHPPYRLPPPWFPGSLSLPGMGRHMCVYSGDPSLSKGRVKGQYLALRMPGPDGGVWKFGQEHPGSQKVAPK